MTASTLSQLPLMAGSVLMTHLGRGAHWAFERYMRAPLASTGVFALVAMSALAGSNALYFQTGVHPSPFFSMDRSVPYSAPVDAASAPMPAPAEMREQAAQDAQQQAAIANTAVSPQTTGSVATVPQAIPEQPVGNAEVFAVQKKLAELQLFQGKVDGYYGPMTARAIRAFEERNGFVPMGALSSGIVSAILGSDSAGRVSTRAPVAQPVVQAQPAPQPQAAIAPAPVVTPAPVQVAASPVQPQPQQDQVVARLPALSPVEQAVDTVGVAAASTIDSIVAAVDGSRGTATPTSNPPVPTASLPAPVQAAPQALVQTASSTVPQTQPRAARPATDGQLVADIQRGLASLGFFRGQIDGNPGPETARAIREFENFHRYKITGQVQPDLIDLLRKAGATI
ncbi:peptidoglycan-binding domain-containing protein [Devosia sp.]|uniref:peptidoglycan-binding domain-containing protein n=1 Tax=Devosia sp. TaxID=1871048 RepID=UPI001AC9F1AE|nr:peptidoglycan-binding domain-containing protein [Devosia sp.]MBN9335572.1 peptidoglycan-binding protein [Devosia sp.]